ncbi:MAG TPA: chorismate-binding protein, partial [Pirellula sp.]|nr:chorismate-binding protein [Pirellula sp.]
YQSLAREFDLVPVYRRLLSDHLTPVSVFRMLDDGHSPACLFESVIGGEKIGRYSFIAIGPRARVVAFRNKVEWHHEGQTTNHTVSDPLAFLREKLGCFSVASLPDLPPFAGGAIGYAAYDVVRYVEKLPNAPKDDRSLPDLDFGFYDLMVVFDNVNKTLLVLNLVSKSACGDDRATYEEAVRRVDEVTARICKSIPSLPPADIVLGQPTTIRPKSNFTQAEFESAVLKCRDYIQAGDVFQVVLSQRFEIESDCEPLEIYRSLRVINPSPFMFLVRTPHCTLVGSSPEVMSRVVDRVATVRPLAGTRPRGKTVEEDQLLARELLADPKERAEHVMLVDLGRNDIGRVAKYGSV